MRAILCAIFALPCAGCLMHTARVEGSGADPAAGRSATDMAVAAGAPSAERRGPLPFEIPASWYLRDSSGQLYAGAAVARSPLPWWQRFPVDLAVDLWPGEVVVATSATVVPQPITARSAADITAEARAHGYAP